MGQKNYTYVDDIQPETRQDILFTSLGVVVLDELLFFSQKRLVDIIGGSGAYSTISLIVLSCIRHNYHGDNESFQVPLELDCSHVSLELHPSDGWSELETIFHKRLRRNFGLGIHGSSW